MALEDFMIRVEPLTGKGISVIHVSGYLDAHTFEQLEETIADLFNAKQHKVIVNLAKVEYISSAGAGVFIGALSEAQEHNGNIILMSPTGNVREVFDLLGLTQIFSVVDNLDAAITAF